MDRGADEPRHNQITGNVTGPVVMAGRVDHVHVRAPRRHRLLITALLISAVGTVLVTEGVVGGSAQPAPAEACQVRTDPSLRSGYVRASRPRERAYTPPDEHQCNSSGAVNTVRWEGTGRYAVRFPGLGVDGGTVDVTSTDPADRVCGVRGWGRAPGRAEDEMVHVMCVDRDGRPADAAFTAGFLFTMGGSGPLAYLRADKPTATTYLPGANHQYNSTGDANSIDRDGPGSYIVFLPGLHKRWGGTVKVTPLGPTPHLCASWGWKPWHNDRTGKDFLFVRVRCATLDGTPVDAAFTLTYTVGLASTDENRVPGAYLWADEPTTDEYTPNREFQYNSTHTLNMVTRTAVGHYTVHLPGFTRKGGNPQVSAYESNATCGVTGWRPVGGEHQATVVCRAPTGEPVDTRFSFIYQQ